ncbi:MAG: isocitrate lyase/phosphoenolpyruvate mutase family protein [Pseudomonadota bacterium]|nr:isocitrate lyase/phosphoenolpyruvate mutase family protein [Pseudomonadota bacterium]
MTQNQKSRAEIFRALHAREGCFVIPNPWDAGSARLLWTLGFEALATTSLGFALTLGHADGAITSDQALQHVRDLAAAALLPLSADLENGFADDPGDAAETIRLAAEAGAVGGSIEDYTPAPRPRIYDFNHAVERVAAAVECSRSLGFPFTLTARAENLIRGVDDLDDTIQRLQAFEKAGADVLYAPGLKTHEQVRAVCSAVSRPVNVLAMPGLTVAGIAEAGGKRISLGSWLARAVAGSLVSAAEEISQRGSFTFGGRALTSARVLQLLEGGKGQS